jgi:CheY-like chemotaxis protein
LQARHEGDETIVKPLRTIEKAATRGRDLVKGLTDFARKGLEQPKVLDLNALIQAELDLLVRTSRQRFIFDVDLEEGLPAIVGEPSILGSAFMNLCVNAFDAMPKGGTLNIRTRSEGGQVELLVADTGEGIPPELLSRVTDPFFTTKPAGRGTGLGLAMVYGAMKAHGGFLDIKSLVGKGTQITLRFPSVTETAAGEASPSTGRIPSGERLHILLVDDDELIRSTLPQMLEQLGHRVETASSGLEAIRRLDAGLAADLVILDHNMPGMSGAETLPRIIQLRPEARIILATGFLDTELKLLLVGFPSVQTLQKPFSMEELRQAVQGEARKPN